MCIHKCTSWVNKYTYTTPHHLEIVWLMFIKILQHLYTLFRLPSLTWLKPLYSSKIGKCIPQSKNCWNCLFWEKLDFYFKVHYLKKKKNPVRRVRCFSLRSMLHICWLLAMHSIVDDYSYLTALFMLNIYFFLCHKEKI